MIIKLITESGDHHWPQILASAPLLVIYKHSPTCGVSAVARDEVRALPNTIPDVPVYQVDVIRQRGLSEAIAAELGVGHESPQVIVVCDGRAVWSASHFQIKAAAVVMEVAKSREACLRQRRSAAQTVA